MIKQQPYSFTKQVYLLATRKTYSVASFQPLTIQLTNLQVPCATLTSFSQLFFAKANAESITQINQNLPSFAFVAAFPYLGQLLLQAKMSDGLLGLIHTKASFNVTHQPNWLEPFDLQLSLEQLQETEKGRIYHLNFTFWQQGQVAITSQNQILAKAKSYQGKAQQQAAKVSNESNEAESDNEKLIATNQLTLKLARQYAQASKDFNPIHLNAFIAKLFGMKTSVMHGMYNLHWSLLQLTNDSQMPVTKVEAEFNRPCYLMGSIPTEVKLIKASGSISESNSELLLMSADGQHRHLKMLVSA